VPLLGVDGQPHHYVAIRAEITQRKLLEESNAQMVAELLAANHELSEFAYVVSHDLKAPLRGISSLASWLATDFGEQLGTEGREHVALIDSRVKRLSALIDAILAYSRAGRQNDNATPVALQPLVSNVIELLAPPQHIRVEIISELPSLMIEAVKIQQVFQNLISNAIDFCDKPEGRVTVDCIPDAAAWHFSVADNGPGIEPKYFERIFGLFQTLTSRDDRERTGVGLALVKKIVELERGAVWVESTVGSGTIFPSPSRTRRARKPRELPEDRTMTPQQHILLVEDDEIDAMTVRRTLKELGAQNPLDRATDGERALVFLRDPANPRPGLILLDLNMPRMNGIEFVTEIKKDAALRIIPVVVLTTSKEEGDRIAAFSNNVAGYMVKPVDYPQFVSVMALIRKYWITSLTPP